jgi:hypothetical protein
VYGNVGSSIYYALGVTAVFALGLTPLVFVVAGVTFACTTLTYAEGTVRYPEAGGSSSAMRNRRRRLPGGRLRRRRKQLTSRGERAGDRLRPSRVGGGETSRG